MSLSFSGFCEQLGAPLYNKAWSWCASAPDKKFSLFTIWEDQIVNGSYTFTTKPRVGETRKRPGRTELISILNDSIDGSFAAYGIQCRAADVSAIPRVRKSFESRYLLDVRLRRDGDIYTGWIVGQVPPQVIEHRGSVAGWIANTAINDIDEDAIINSDPEYRKRMSGQYVRDAKVRANVLKRARGKCEECGQFGFLKADGTRYLETHHIISLSEQGADQPHNVIALCANDHRRAHFASDWASLQDKFLKKLQGYRAVD